MMWSWFLLMIFGVFVGFTAFIFLLPNSSTLLLALLILLGIPFWILYCLFMMVPDITIFGVTVFSRRKLSVRNSVSVGGRIAYMFSKEFFRQHPQGAFVIFGYFVLLFLTVVIAVAL